MSNKRTFTIVLAALMVVVLLVCVLAACDPKHKDPVPPGPEGGTYYFDAGAEEYTVSLEADSKFTLNILGETHSGWYSLSGSALLLNFDDDSEQLSAQLTNNYNTLEFTYNGQAYTFLRKTEFTVTFDTGGGTQIDPVTVLNGKTISKPDAPSKDGNFVFEGWYSDNKFEFKYDFDAPVTGDITLHANYVSSIREPIEFTVKFAGDGGFEPIQTIKGVAYGLPEPKKDGDKFVGWWVSSSNEQDKLSYQYEGQKLTENTTFFPVWQSQLVGGMEVSVNAEGIFWTGKNDVTISIVSPAGVTSETITGRENEYLFDSNNYKLSQNGEYKFTVKAAGSDDATVRYFVNGRLSRVSCFEVENGSNSLKFNHVANAQSYNVSIVTKDGVKQETLDAATVQNNTMVFDFSAYDIPADGYVFTVEAVGKGYLNSTSDQFNYNRFLDKVAQPVFDEATQSFSWQAVEHANRYVVKLNGEQVLDGPSVTFDLKDKDPGTYSIEVQPFGFGYNAPEATTKNIDKQKLAAPSNLKPSTDGKSIVWDHVKDSVGYIVYKGDKELAEPATESFVFNGSLLSGGAVDIYVVAKSSDPKLNSPKSNAMNVSNRVENITYNKGVISWSFVLGISKYFVKINDGQELEVNGTSTNALPLVAKTNVISVRPENGESNTATVEAFEISFDLGYEGGVKDSLFKTAGDDVTLTPPANRWGYDFTYWTDESGKQFLNGTFEGKSDTVYHANWTAHVFDVQFDFQDLASDEEASATKYQGQKVTYGSSGFTLPVPETASKDFKYAFEGWYLGTASNSQKIADHSGKAVGAFIIEPQDGKLTLYANWVEIFKFEQAEGGWRVSKNGDNINYLSEVTVPAKQGEQWVVAISDFSGCTNLKTLNIPSSISQINFADQGVSFAGDTALTAVNVYKAEGYNDVVKYSAKDGVLFENDVQGNAVKLIFCPLGKISKLTEYTVPSGTKTIAAGAFYTSKHIYNLFKLSKVNFPATLEKIEKNAFYNIDSITELKFLPAQQGETEASGLNIESLAFNGESRIYSAARHITDLTLPKRITDDMLNILLELEGLDNIYVEEGGEFESVEGVLCKKIKDSSSLELFFFPHGRYSAQKTSSYIIPNNVTKIGAKAFLNYSDLKEITIGGHVTDIGESAFEGCVKLTKITFLGTKESSDLHIAKRAFYAQYSGPITSIPSYVGNSSIAELTLPANLVSLGEMAFAFYTRLTNVNVEVERDSVDFEDNAFVNVSSDNGSYVTDVTIGAGVPEFAIAAVFGAKLAKVTVAKGNKYYANDDTGNGVLYNADFTSIVFFPKTFRGAYTIPENMTVISGSLFAGCTEITSITLHKGVTSIGDYAFKGCTGLQQVNFGEEPYGELSIGTQAFASCTGLQNIKFPEGLKSLGDRVFSDCSKLQTVALPASLESITFDESEGFMLFANCTTLQEFTIAEGNKNYGAYDDVLYRLRKVTTEDGEEAYEEDSLLFCPYGKDAKVTVPGTVRSVQANSFSGSRVTEIFFEDLVETTDVEGQDDVDLVIMAGAFYNTPQLQKLHLPEGMTRLDQKIFYSSLIKTEEAFDTLEIPASMEFIGANLFEGSFKLQLIVTFAEAKEGQEVKGLTIEDAVDKRTSAPGGGGQITVKKGLFVTIGSTANKVAINIAPITFPSHLVHLGDEALYQTKVESVKFNEPAKKEDGSYKYQLTIGKSALYSATNLTQLTLPANVTEIGDSAFYGTKVKEIKLPESLTKIGNSAFHDGAFSSVTIPANVTTIGTSAFSGVSTGTVKRSYLTQVQFAEGSKLETIGDEAFNAQSIETLELPASLKSIGANAFSAIATLKSVTFAPTSEGQEPVELSIGNNAFAGDYSLTNITVPARTTSLGSNVFLNSGLVVIEFENGSEELTEDNSKLESIGDSAFASTRITQITLPKTAKELKLGASLFVGCSKLTKITISSTVLDISNVFSGISAVEHISVAKANPKFVEGENNVPIIYEKDEQSNTKSIVLIYNEIEDTLKLTGTKIGAGALANLTNIKHITIAASVVEIGEKAFENCISLETVTIEAGSALQTVGAYAFQNCALLTEVDFSNAANLTTFGDGAVKNSYSGASASDIAGNTGIFNGCSKLQKVTLGSGVTKLGTAMFAGSGVVTVDMSKATKLEEWSEGAFANTPNLTTIILPAKENNNLVHLGRYTFYGSGVKELDFSSCVKLKYTAYSKEIALDPTADKTINGSSAYAATFAYATALTTVKLPSSMLGIGPHTFRGCKALTTVTGIDNVTDFYNYCFYGVGDLKLTLGDIDVIFEQESFRETGNVQITPPANHKMTFKNSSTYGMFFNSKIKSWTIRTQDDYSAAKYMFNKCTALTTVKVEAADDAVAKEGFTAIPDSMFAGCTNLKSFDFSKLKNLQTIGSSAFAALTGELDLSATSLTSIGTSAFASCKITSVKLPATLESIGNSAFNGCGELLSVDFTPCTKLETIGSKAFMKCTKLQSLDMSTTIVTDLKSEAFSTCSKLVLVILPKTISSIEAKVFQDCTALMELDLSNTSVTKFSTGESTAVTTSTSAYTFDGCTNLKFVKVNGNFSEVGGYAFQDCTNFDGIVDSWGNPVTTITKVGQSAFKNCKALSQFDFTNVELLGSSAFSNTGLTEVTLPEIQFGASSSLGTSVFNGNLKLQTVKIPAGFSVGNNVGKEMFKGCTMLSTVTFLENVEAVERYLPTNMFAGCTKLTSVDLTNAYITSLPQEMFSGDNKLTEVTLSEMITEIGKSAFSGCKSLATINLKDVVTIGATAFKDCALTSVEFEKLESLAIDAFVGNGKLKQFKIVPGGAADENFFANDVQFGTKDGTTVYMSIFEEVPEDGVLDLTAKEDIVLSANMFQGVEGLKEVKLPTTITAIPDSTFAGSTITKMDLSTLTLLESIGANAFADTPLSDFTWAPALKTIGAQAFRNTQLASVEIPATVTSIGQGAFANCTMLTSVTLADGEEELILADGSKNPKTSTNAELGVFENAPITNLSLGNRLKTIPARAFATSKTVKFTGTEGYALNLSVEKVNDYAFYGSFVGPVTFDEKLTYIGAAAFAKTTKLTSVTFHDDVSKEVQFKMNGNGTANETSDEAQYFGVFEASALSSVVGMPKFVNEKTQAAEIGSRMFKDCANLKELTINNNTTVIADYAFYKTPIATIALDGVAEIGARAFYGTKLTAIDLPETLTSIGTGAFYEAQISELTLPANLTSIGAQAFYKTKLTTLNIPANVTSIGQGAFADTTLKTLTFANGDGTIEFGSGSTSSSGTHTDKNCGVFDNCVELSSVTFGNRVQTISASMFYNCTALKTIDLPIGVVICDAAFASTGLTTVNNLDKVKELKGFRAFENSKIINLTLDVSTIIGTGAFQNCGELLSVTFTNKDNIASMQELNQTFKACKKLTTVTLCEGITKLYMTFVDCESLTTVNLPDTLTELGSQAFQNCKALKMLVLPNGLKTINANAFDGCTEKGKEKDLKLCFKTSKSVAYAMTYDASKTPSSPLPKLEETYTVVYNYDPQAEAEAQPAPSESGTQELMQTAMGNVAYADEH